ncbi:peptidoglycan/xylan/chitin deacetylase (PgdA/CDA1 family) [Tamaricihabitans halophyticus]|uniref:Peptidoglycan/xylan/chitin deacetylase (PgdA/CDA1 family) n=1 Tax=Tamaricihabitans halophyticus TaxID=1262583 RepID=A0A4R2QGB9_9PSEU|nr:polysaccharide deacetylase family protein [Tamaricihabitans halophyticus]TCP47378.1 peptidoglycan/xylan/chitin deacetylase (PgdA/CDA1 family) [Tamaricihabitans halophyticus]
MIGSIATVLTILLASYGVHQLANARSFQLFGELTHRVDTSHKVVALTFDDGPDPAGTAPLLATLAEADVPATFYLTGQDLAKYPELGADIARAGHEIGNHSYSHERMVLVSKDWVAGEVADTDQLIRDTGYTGPITFRPPNGKKLVSLPRYLAEHNRHTVMWDVAPEAELGENADAAAIAEHTVEQVEPGSIVLLHPMFPGRAAVRDAVEPIIEQLQADGYQFVTVAELLRYQRD